MREARLASHVEIAALVRTADARGGHAAILHRGDREAGAILILLAERGVAIGIVERFPQLDGRYGWQFRAIEEIERKQSVNDYMHRRVATDSDLWAIELDIPRAERFAAELAAAG